MLIYTTSNEVKYNSKDLPGFKGKNFKSFIKFLYNKKLDLRNLNLSNLDLSYMELNKIDLSYSDLSNTDLSYTDLINSNLTEVNLSNANLYHANLFYSNLSNADLSNAQLTKINLSNAQLLGTEFTIESKWNITYYKNQNNKIIIKIGCKPGTIKYWDNFFSSKCTEEFSTPRDHIEFKRIKANYKSVRTFIKEMGNDLFDFN